MSPIRQIVSYRSLTVVRQHRGARSRAVVRCGGIGQTTIVPATDAIAGRQLKRC